MLVGKEIFQKINTECRFAGKGRTDSMPFSPNPSRSLTHTPPITSGQSFVLVHEAYEVYNPKGYWIWQTPRKVIKFRDVLKPVILVK